MSAISDINVTPLIDLAFALLIIFMITTPLLEQTIPLNLPLESKSSTPTERKPAFQVVSINAEGHIHWGKDKVDLEKLSDLLSTMSQQNNPPTLKIRADRTLPYQSVIEVIELIKKNQLSKISLDTQVK